MHEINEKLTHELYEVLSSLRNKLYLAEKFRWRKIIGIWKFNKE